MTDRITLAARNNALWCDLVARSHGVRCTLDGDAWTAATRTPPYYPDAVTLSATVSENDVLARVDDSPGCSVKDSWSRLDLSLADFAQLVIGEWVWLDPGSAVMAPAGMLAEVTWCRVTTDEGMAVWAGAWARDPEAEDILRPSLLGEPGVHVLAGHASNTDDSPVVAGAVVNVTGVVAGISNVFSRGPDAEAAWRAAAVAAREMVGGIPLVGWEAGAGLDAAVSAGCERLGQLSVWVK